MKEERCALRKPAHTTAYILYTTGSTAEWSRSLIPVHYEYVVLYSYSVKHEISCFALKLDECWVSETIWNFNSYSHNAEQNNLMFLIIFIFFILKLKFH